MTPRTDLKPVVSNPSFPSGRTKWWDSRPKVGGSTGALDFPASLLHHSKKVLALATLHFYLSEVFRFGLVYIPWRNTRWID